MYGSMDELPALQGPAVNGAEHLPGAATPKSYPIWATISGSLIVIQFLTLSPNALKHILA